MIYLVRYFLIAFYTVFWGTVGCVLAWVNGDALVWAGRHWIQWVFKTCGITLEVEGEAQFAPGQPYLIMPNHQSVLDIGAVALAFPYSWRFVAKRELLWIPFFGWALALSDQIVIDRKNHQKSVESLRAVAKRVREGATVIIFPEGTRSPDGALKSFKSGGFHLAIEAGVPIVPTTISGSRKLTPKHSLRVESGPIKVVFGAPIPTAHLTVEDRQELKEQVRNAILQGFDPAFQRGCVSSDSAASQAEVLSDPG